jgi:hypothetical protein
MELLVLLAQQALKEFRVCQERMEQMVQLEQPDRPAQLEPMVLMARTEQPF